jgi:O-antigen ligase
MSAAWVVLPDEQKNRLRTLWDPEAGPANAQASTEGRVVAFQAAVAIFEKNPLLGVGPGNFKDYRQSYGDGIYLSPHNLLGNVISELGILGTATFLLVVVATFLNCAKMKALARRVRHPDVLVLNGLGIACRNAVILLLVEGISDHDLYRFNWFWLAAFCLVALECYREAETELETIAVDAVEEPVPEFAEEF